MNLLALETATTHCSVALLHGDERLQLDESAPQKHAALLLPMVEKLLAQAGLSKTQLDAVAFGRGPGSFTGLRIAAAAAQGISLGLDLPVVGVSTLASLAHQRYRVASVSHCIACLDARMSEIYWGFFETTASGACAETADEQVGSVEDLLKILSEGEVSGSFAAYCEVAGDGANLLLPSNESGVVVNQVSCLAGLQPVSDIHPQALDVALLALPRVLQGDVVEAASALPVYLRNRVALTERERENKKRD